MSNIIDIYKQGGIQFMHLITILLLMNLAIAVYIVYSRIKLKEISPNWLEALKHVSGFAVALGTFGTLFGLLFAFDALEKSEQVIPFPIIMGGLKVSLINILYGLIVFFISMVVYLILKLTKNTRAAIHGA
jgi:hypothetical protein